MVAEIRVILWENFGKSWEGLGTLLQKGSQEYANCNQVLAPGTRALAEAEGYRYMGLLDGLQLGEPGPQVKGMP